MSINNFSLMIPGPIELTDEVRFELSQQVNAHYGKEWADFYNNLIFLLKKIFQTKSDVFCMVGTGTAGIESVISSIISPGEKIIVLNNGFFGNRLAEIGRAYRADVVEVSFPLNAQIDVDQVRKELNTHKKIKAVAMVHSESSTGMLNPLKDISSLCNEFNIPLIVDAVSSLGGTEIKMDEWAIGACISASQKCLEGPTGLALIAISDTLWPIIENTQSLGWYLNLKIWKDIYYRWHENHPHPTSMSTPLVRALNKSLENILSEGLDKRFERHLTMSRLLRTKLANMGFSFFLPFEISSPTLVSVNGSKELPSDFVVSELKKRHGIQIAGGIGPLEGKIFRIGCMGSSAKIDKIEKITYAIKDIVENH